MSEDNEASAAIALASSASREELIEVTADNNALSFSRSIDSTKSTTSLNWSRLTDDPSRIASIRPLSTEISEDNPASADILADSSVEIEEFNKFRSSTNPGKSDFWIPVGWTICALLSIKSDCWFNTILVFAIFIYNF